MAFRALLLSLVLMCASQVAAAGEPVRIGTEGAYPPFSAIRADGELVGFDIDLTRALCAEMDADCTFVVTPWDDLLPALEDGIVDAVVASLSITEERLERVAFTDPYYSNKLRFVAEQEGGFDPRAPKGETIGAQGGTVSADYLRDNFGGRAAIRLFETQDQAFAALEAGDLDAVLADMLVTFKWLQQGAHERFRFVGEPVVTHDRVGIAVRKDDAELRRRLNAALARIIADGTYDRINAAYFPFSIY